MRDNTVQLAEPVEQLAGDDVTEVPTDRAEIAAAIASEHPPTNQRLVAETLAFWVKTVGANDPISRSLASWLCYLVNEDVSQLDAGMTFEQHDALVERLDELGITEEDTGIVID
jgi:hypothetical protein